MLLCLSVVLLLLPCLSASLERLFMRNPSLHPLISGYACYYCCMPIVTGIDGKGTSCQSSPSDITIFMFLYFLALSSLHPYVFIHL